MAEVRYLYGCFLLMATLASSGYALLEVVPSSVPQLQIEELKGQMLTMQQTINNLTNLQATVAALQAQQAICSQNINHINHTIHHPRVVAFMAQLTQSLTHLGTNQHVPFDHVITNTGHAYDPKTGHFTAPYTGQYVFHFTVTNLAQYDTSMKMVKNGTRITHSVSHGDGTPGSQTKTVTSVAVVTLHKNDQVWVQNEGPFSAHEGLTGSFYSSFSGHMITPVFQ